MTEFSGSMLFSYLVSTVQQAGLARCLHLLAALETCGLLLAKVDDTASPVLAQFIAAWSAHPDSLSDNYVDRLSSVFNSLNDGANPLQDRLSSIFHDALLLSKPQDRPKLLLIFIESNAIWASNLFDIMTSRLQSECGCSSSDAQVSIVIGITKVLETPIVSGAMRARLMRSLTQNSAICWPEHGKEWYELAIKSARCWPSQVVGALQNQS